jgi:hypothetical protein
MIESSCPAEHKTPNIACSGRAGLCPPRGTLPENRDPRPGESRPIPPAANVRRWAAHFYLSMLSSKTFVHPGGNNEDLHKISRYFSRNCCNCSK